MTKEKPIEIKFKLDRINTYGFSYSEKEPDSLDISKSSYNFNVRFRIVKDKNEFGIRLLITITYDPDPKIIFGSLDAECVFLLDDITKIPHDDQNISIPNNIMVNFLAIAISTMRGILYEKGRGTVLEKLIMPVIDPNKLLPVKKKSKSTKKK